MPLTATTSRSREINCRTAYNAIDCRRAFDEEISSVTLTLVVTLTVANAQQGSDPCDAATFNAKVCKVRFGAEAIARKACE